MKNNIIDLKPFISGNLEDENEAAYFAEMEDNRRTDLEQEEAWRRHRAIHGFPGEDDVPVDDGYRYFDHDDVDLVMAAFEELVEQQRSEQIEAVEALGIIRGLLQAAYSRDRDRDPEPEPEPETEVWEPAPDQPISLAQALCLPELGGTLFKRGKGIPTGSVTRYAIRDAIKSGRLKLHASSMPGFHKLTRNLVKEWIQSTWQEDENHPVSSSKASGKTRTAAPKPPSTSSNITTRERERQLSSAQASALEKLRMRRSTLQNG